MARNRLVVQSNKLEESINRLQERNKGLFEKCVASKASGNHSRALVYANECAEIRKIARIIINGQLALEQVILRLETVEELGDIFIQLGPLIGIVQEIQGQLTGVLPEVSFELGEINSALNNAVLEAGTATDNAPVVIPVSDEDAEKVLAEAKIIADERMKERFPSLPKELESESLKSEERGSGELESEKLASEESKSIDEVAEEDLEERVYDYVLSVEDRNISISACASALDMPTKSVKAAINSLIEKKRISVEEKKEAAIGRREELGH
ncbi:MAG: hypothetical protein JSW01_05415 [Candidatus Bathyarchaeota archaeon]|nr:MAG: hypothetical protein JSW01_05415 [Candidatus Bathyarchaeota archaeon]